MTNRLFVCRVRDSRQLIIKTIYFNQEDSCIQLWHCDQKPRAYKLSDWQKRSRCFSRLSLQIDKTSLQQIISAYAVRVKKRCRQSVGTGQRLKIYFVIVFTH